MHRTARRQVCAVGHALAAGLLAVGVGLGIWGCGDRAGEADPPAIGARAGGEADLAAADGPLRDESDPVEAAALRTSLTDAQIGSVVIALHAGEIQLAELALRRSDVKKVRRFAQRIVDEHRALERATRAELQALDLQPESDPLAAELVKLAQDMALRLETVPADEFDRAYLKGQIALLRRAHGLLDRRLIGEADDPDLARTLDETRERLEEHVGHAQQVRGRI